MKRALIYIFVFFAIIAAVQMSAAGIYKLVCPEAGDEMPTMWNIGIMVVRSVIIIVVFLHMGWGHASRSYMRSRPWAVLVWSVLAATGAIVPSMFLQELIPEWTGWAQEIAEENRILFEALLNNRFGYMVIALLPPVVEELVFRGAVLRSLLRWKPGMPWAMIAVSALFFAIIHLNPAQMPHAFIIGLLLGWMYKRTGSIIPGVAYHWANNTIAYVMYHVYHNPESPADLFGDDTRRQLLALAFSLCILIPSLLQLNLHMTHESGDQR